MLGGFPQIYGVKPNIADDVVGEHDPGTLGVGLDGRIFRYVACGAAGVAVGNLQTAPAQITNHHELVVNTALAGALTLDITPGNTAGNANIYFNGLVVVNDDTGEGFNYRIKSHPAITGNTEFTLTLFDPIETAFVAGTTVTLQHNPWNGVIEGTSSTEQPVGVTANDLTATRFGWVCSRGTAACLADETLTVGAALTNGTSVAGSVEELDDIVVPLTDNLIGWAIVAGIAEERRPIQVRLD